jgi:hypothetical protein
VVGAFVVVLVDIFFGELVLDVDLTAVIFFVVLAPVFKVVLVVFAEVILGFDDVLVKALVDVFADLTVDFRVLFVVVFNTFSFDDAVVRFVIDKVVDLTRWMFVITTLAVVLMAGLVDFLVVVDDLFVEFAEVFVDFRLVALAELGLVVSTIDFGDFEGGGETLVVEADFVVLEGPVVGAADVFVKLDLGEMSVELGFSDAGEDFIDAVNTFELVVVLLLIGCKLDLVPV